jgi:hypothetical protein
MQTKNTNIFLKVWGIIWAILILILLGVLAGGVIGIVLVTAKVIFGLV